MKIPKIPDIHEITNWQTFVYGTIGLVGGWTGNTMYNGWCTLKRLEQIDRFERGKK